MNEYFINHKNNIPFLEIKEQYITDYKKELGDFKKLISFCNEELLMPLLNIEHLYVFAYDSNDNVLGFMLLDIGDENSTKVDNKKMITFLLLSGAAQFLLIHNHPNGNALPSTNDKLTNGSMKVVAGMFDIHYIDGLTIGDISWCFVSTGEEHDF